MFSANQAAEIVACILLDEEQPVLFKIKQLLSYLATLDELRASCHAERRQPIFGAKIEAWKHKMVHIFHFLPATLVSELVNPF